MSDIPDSRREDAQIAGYVQAFRESADRSRRVIFVITTVCILLFIASWNVYKESWARRRITLENERELFVGPPAPMTHQQRVEDLYRGEVGWRYPDEYVRRMLVVQLPLIGIATDVNEFGVFGGITLTLLMLLLSFALMRQHENLYLSIFKVARLHRSDPKMNDGASSEPEGMANYLYHTLAMSQVLNTPPTLARWEVRGRNKALSIAMKLFFFIPVGVQGFILYTNLATLPVAKIHFGELPYGRLLIQAGVIVLLFALGTNCWIYARAMDKRWREIFFHINPRLRSRSPSSWWAWTQLRSQWTKEEKQLRRQLQAALQQHTGKAGARSELTVRYVDRVWGRQGDIPLAALQLMKSAIRRIRTEHAAEGWIVLLGFELHTVTRAKAGLDVDMTWSYHVVDEK